VARLRADENGLDSALRSTTEEAARLRRSAWRPFASWRACASTRSRVTSSSANSTPAERRALQLLADRRQSFDRLSSERHRAEEEVRAAESERHARAENLEEAIRGLEELRGSIDAKIHASPEWGAQRRRIDAAIMMAEEAEKKAAQAEADREAKGKPYEADPLFMYLWRAASAPPNMFRAGWCGISIARSRDSSATTRRAPTTSC
jgi:hypothetical protein